MVLIGLGYTDYIIKLWSLHNNVSQYLSHYAVLNNEKQKAIYTIQTG